MYIYFEESIILNVDNKIQVIILFFFHQLLLNL